MRSQICLIRHGITEGNVRRLYYGKTDVPLAQKGIDELEKLAEEKLYPDSKITRIFTTGMIRTNQTKHLIYGDRPHETIEYLQEINFGEFEMKSYEQLLENEDYRDWITAENYKKAPPGGESLDQFNERIVKGYEELMKIHSQMVREAYDQDPEGDDGDEDWPLSVVICHGGTISALMDYLWPEINNNMYDWIPDPGHGYLLTLEEEKFVEYEKF